MITLHENAVQVDDSSVTIGEWFQIDENNGLTKRFTPNTIVMDRAEAIELAKAILASVEIEEVLDDEDAWADERAVQLEDFATLADDVRF